MNLIIFELIVTIAALPAHDKSSGELWTKLNQYKEITGLSDESIMATWIKSIGVKADVKQGIATFILVDYFQSIEGKYPKFRVSTAKKISGDVNPIQYDIIDYNDEIEYNNGVVLILRPGWYTFTSNIRGADNMRPDQFTNLWMVVNQGGKSHGGK